MLDLEAVVAARHVLDGDDGALGGIPDADKGQPVAEDRARRAVAARGVYDVTAAKPVDGHWRVGEKLGPVGDGIGVAHADLEVLQKD